MRMTNLEKETRGKHEHEHASYDLPTESLSAINRPICTSDRLDSSIRIYLTHGQLTSMLSSSPVPLSTRIIHMPLR